MFFETVIKKCGERNHLLELFDEAFWNESALWDDDKGGTAVPVLLLDKSALDFLLLWDELCVLLLDEEELWQCLVRVPLPVAVDDAAAAGSDKWVLIGVLLFMGVWWADSDR